MGRLLLVAPVLPVDVLETAAILERNDLLDCLVTRYSPSPSLARVLSKNSFAKRFSKRPIASVSRERKVESLLADLGYYLARPLSRTKATDFSFSIVDRIASHRVRQELGAVLTREDSAMATFRAATRIGVKKIYALPTAYWRTVRNLMRREEEEFPGICKAELDAARQAERRYLRKDLELQMADFLLAPSTFVRESLSSAPDFHAPVKVLPFGCDSHWETRAAPQPKAVFLYAGNITMRKGVHRLLRAWKKLNAHRTAELRLIGDMFLDERFLRDYHGIYTHIPRLPRAELLQHYAESSAFVFNSVADGFGYVIPEAMSCRVPVIASRNSGAPDILRDKIDGMLVDYGSDEQLMTCLDWALSNSSQLVEMGCLAEEASRKWTWANYAQEFIKWLRPVVAS